MRCRSGEKIVAWTKHQTELGDAMARASAAARAAVPVSSEHETAIRDVAADVAGPALAGFVLWSLSDALDRRLDRLCFLARDGQVLYHIAKAMAPRVGLDVDLRYVFSSRRTWSFAAADPAGLASQDWLFNSFMRSNAEDVCARLGLQLADFGALAVKAGVSLDPEVRANDAFQNAALRRFVSLPEVEAAVAPRISRMRQLVRDYAVQEGLTSARTGLVDAGWTGRMIAALGAITGQLPQPRVYFWGHEPRAAGWSDERLVAWMYDTGTGAGMSLRVPDTPYIIESFCMSDHGITADYLRGTDGSVQAVPASRDNPAVHQWGMPVFRATIRSFCEALLLPESWRRDDIRPAVSELLHRFWITPTPAEAAAWGAYLFDSDPLARAARPLATPFTENQMRSVAVGGSLELGDRAWLQGSLCLSGTAGAAAAQALEPRYRELGAPAPD